MENRGKTVDHCYTKDSKVYQPDILCPFCKSPSTHFYSYPPLLLARCKNHPPLTTNRAIQITKEEYLALKVEAKL